MEPTEPEFKVVDSFGVELKKGGRVIMDVEPEGTILHISDPDGDADAEGRIYEIPPQVTVLWDGEDGGDLDMFGEKFSAHYDWKNNRYVCDDIEAAKENS